jgi:putative membrane protein
MNFPSPKKLTGATNELAKERNREAAERTLTSWIQNCVYLLGFGMAFDRIVSAVARTFRDPPSLLTRQLAHRVGLVAIALGISLLLFAVSGYLAEMKAIEQEDDRPIRLFYPTLVGAVVLYGLITFSITLLIPN